MSEAKVTHRLNAQGAGWRCAKAAAAIALALAAIPVSEHLVSVASGASALSSIFFEDGTNLSEASADSSLSTGSEASDESTRTFTAEVFDMQGLNDMRANEDCSVVGFTKDGNAVDTFSWLSALLKERGWISVNSNSDCMGSFVKESGEYRWLFANCVGIGQETSVVLCVC